MLWLCQLYVIINLLTPKLSLQFAVSGIFWSVIVEAVGWYVSLAKKYLLCQKVAWPTQDFNDILIYLSKQKRGWLHVLLIVKRSLLMMLVVNTIGCRSYNQYKYICLIFTLMWLDFHNMCWFKPISNIQLTVEISQSFQCRIKLMSYMICFVILAVCGLLQLFKLLYIIYIYIYPYFHKYFGL